MPVRFFKYEHPFALECGQTLPSLTVAYHTFGRMRGDNAVWVCHALTANSDVADWWPRTVEKDRFLDPEKYFTVCANIIGSHYGSTGPLSVNPETGKPYYGDFPFVTVRDMARVNLLLAGHLGIKKVRALIGSSIGGFQALEMALLDPDFAERLILVATAACARPWTVAINESQRMAIEADSTFGKSDGNAGMAGMSAARSIGLLSYRGSLAYNATQQESDSVAKRDGYRAATYQRHQGEKLCRRFDAYSYWAISKAFDTHDVGRGRGGTQAALHSIEIPTLTVGITSDIVLPVAEQIFLYRHIPHNELHLLSSDFGHDGFLVEADKLNAILKPFIEKTHR